MVFEAQDQYPSQLASIESIAGKIGCTSETLRRRVRQAERDQGLRDGLSTAEQQRIKALLREVCEMRKANEIVKLASAFLCPGGARPLLPVVSEFSDRYRDRFAVEPIRKALQVAPSGYQREAAQRGDSVRCPPRRQRDAALLPEIERVWRSSLQAYGADKAWKQLRREGAPAARFTVERLMRTKSWRGFIRGKAVRTTVSDAKAPCRLGLVSCA